MFSWFRSKDPLEPQRAAIRRGELPAVPAGWKCWRNGVAGESFKNPDGISRQDIIRRLKVGESVRLEADPGNRRDKAAVKVMAADGQIGFLPQGHGLNSEVEEGRLFGFVAAIRSGEKGIYGVTIVLVRQPKA